MCVCSTLNRNISINTLATLKHLIPISQTLQHIHFLSMRARPTHAHLCVMCYSVGRSGRNRCALPLARLPIPIPPFSTFNLSCKPVNLKFRLRELTSCLCCAAAWTVCFEGSVTGLDATETGNEFSQLKFYFISLFRREAHYFPLGD